MATRTMYAAGASALHELGPRRAGREPGRELERERRDLRRALAVDLLPVVAGAMVVAVEAGEEVDGGNLARLEVGVVASTGPGALPLDAQAAEPLARRSQILLDRRRVLEPAHIDAAARPAHHV